MIDCTLCIILKDEGKRILLVTKKEGLAKGRMNSAGGKIEAGETPEECAKREVFEETGIEVRSCRKVAFFEFYFPPSPEWNQRVHVFMADEWSGEPHESDEVVPGWFDVDKIPYDKMWADDIHWVPHVLKGKMFRGMFEFSGERAENIEKMELEEVKSWE